MYQDGREFICPWEFDYSKILSKCLYLLALGFIYVGLDVVAEVREK